MNTAQRAFTAHTTGRHWRRSPACPNCRCQRSKRSGRSCSVPTRPALRRLHAQVHRRRAWTRSSTPSMRSGRRPRLHRQPARRGLDSGRRRLRRPGFSGGNMERPALKRLMADIEAGKIDIVVVYKIDRLTRSLADFSKMVEVFERHGCRSSRSRSSSTPPPRWGG
jgi:hypothetical protein